MPHHNRLGSHTQQQVAGPVELARNQRALQAQRHKQVVARSLARRVVAAALAEHNQRDSRAPRQEQVQPQRGM